MQPNYFTPQLMMTKHTIDCPPRTTFMYEPPENFDAIFAPRRTFLSTVFERKIGEWWHLHI